MHQFHLNFTERSSIMKDRSNMFSKGYPFEAKTAPKNSSLIRGVICKILNELGPFLTSLSICGFRSITFEGMQHFFQILQKGEAS